MDEPFRKALLRNPTRPRPRQSQLRHLFIVPHPRRLHGKPRLRHHDQLPFNDRPPLQLQHRPPRSIQLPLSNPLRRPRCHLAQRNPSDELSTRHAIRNHDPVNPHGQHRHLPCHRFPREKSARPLAPCPLRAPARTITEKPIVLRWKITQSTSMPAANL